MINNRNDSRGSIGEPRPDKKSVNAQTRGSLPQERAEDRENVGIVKPEDYPEADRASVAELVKPPK